ncbi:MAG: thiamine pyrophosphate-dependent dehydrogenase E1 component subunit alpha [Pseudomonadota bacterium]
MTSLDKQALLRAYRRMRTIRDFEDRLHVEIAAGQVAGFTHLYAGQEAIAVGVCEHLSEKDSIISTHRGHGHCIAKGADVKRMMKEIFGSSEGTCNGKGGSMHIAEVDRGILGANAIVGGGPPIAVGAALAGKLRGDGTVAVSFSGDGSTNQGTTFEAMNMAKALQVPKVFVIENNGYAENTGADYGSGGVDIAARTEGFGIPVFRADGADFFDVYRATGEAVAHARGGGGPAGVYAEMQRYYGHYEGDPQKYRAPDEPKNLRETHDCLKNYRQRVADDGSLAAAELDQIDAEVAELIEAAVTEAKAAPRPSPEDVTTDVYINYRGASDAG